MTAPMVRGTARKLGLRLPPGVYYAPLRWVIAPAAGGELDSVGYIASLERAIAARQSEWGHVWDEAFRLAEQAEEPQP